MDETLELIQLTQQQIHRAQLYVDLSEHMGTITPEMEQTVSEVKRIIFGEYDDDPDFVPATLDTGGTNPVSFAANLMQIASAPPI